MLSRVKENERNNLVDVNGSTVIYSNTHWCVKKKKYDPTHYNLYILFNINFNNIGRLKMFAKKGQSKIKRIAVGGSISFIGLVLATVGYSTGNILIGRSGLILMAMGGWIISWT